MNCEHVQAVLTAYLDGEVSLAEGALIEAHLAYCETCQTEKALTTLMQKRLGVALRQQAHLAAPSPLAWTKLETRLAQATRPMPAQSSALAPHRWVQLGERLWQFSTSMGLGDTLMLKRSGLALTALVVVSILAGISLFRNATPVSAQEILQRSYAAQQQASVVQGIEHLRTEVYWNFQTLPKGKPGLVTERRTLIDSYLERQSSKNRLVLTDAATSEVLDASGFDGAYVYTGQADESGVIKTIYRVPQPAGTADLPEVNAGTGPIDQKSLYEAALQDPTAKLTGEETRAGRQVYEVQLKRLGKALFNTQADTQPDLTSTLFFDVQTYELVEQRDTVQQAGQEVLVYSSRQLIHETLPATAMVAWDMSDLSSVTLVDDPNAEHGDELPVPISPHDLAQRTHSAYQLQTVPEGFTMQLSAPPHVSAQEPGVYLLDYRNADGDYIHLQGDSSVPETVLQSADETYTTQSGFTLYFERNFTDPNGKTYTGATVKAPDGTLFELTSTLSRERLKALAETLVSIR